MAATVAGVSRDDGGRGAMSKKQSTPDRAERSRYEFRVWGKHRKARRALSRFAPEPRIERYIDCYVLSDDPTWNAKVRGNRLKIKRLVATDKGFERWTRGRFPSASQAPDPITVLFEALHAERERLGESFVLSSVASEMAERLGVRVVLARKVRHHYQVGSVRVEVTEIEVAETGELHRTLSIEGDDLAELVRMRKRLGLSGEPNLAVHQVLERGQLDRGRTA